MSVLKNVLIILVVLAVIVIGIGFFLPTKVGTSREIVIDAPPQTVYATFNSLRGFNRWSPWAKMDPNTQYTFTGPAFGVGSKMAWASEHKNVGNGSIEITANKPGEWIESALDFGPQGTATASYRVSPVDGGTKAVWSFETETGTNPLKRLQGQIIPIFVGKSYDEGLANLKTLVESFPKQDFADLPMTLEKNQPQTYAYVSASSPPDSQSIGAAMGGAFGKVMGFIQEHQLQMVGQPMSMTTAMGETYDFDAAIPIAEAPAEMPADETEVKIGKTHEGMVVKAVHKGSYNKLGESFEKIDAFLKASGLEIAGQPWEVYVSDPTQTPEEEVITHLYRPIK